MDSKFNEKLVKWSLFLSSTVLFYLMERVTASRKVKDQALNACKIGSLVFHNVLF